MVIPNITPAAPTLFDLSFSQIALSPALRPSILSYPIEPFAIKFSAFEHREEIVHSNNPELKSALRPLPLSFNDMVRASKAARRDEKNVFRDILDTIDAKDWFDGVVDQPLR